MPVIPIKQNVAPAFGTFLPTRRATGEDFDTAGAAARALGQAGEKIQQAGDALQTSFERDDVLTAHKSIADIRTQQTLRIQKMQEEGGPDGDIGAITTTATQEADAALSAARAKLGTGKGKRIFDALGADLKAVLVPRAAAVQAHLIGLKAKAQFDETLNTLGTALVSDPSQLQSALKQAEIGIANTPGLPADARIQLAEHAKHVLTKAAVQGLINVNPWAAETALKAGKFDATLKTEDKAALINAAETQQRARRYDAEASAAAQLRAQRLKDLKLQSDALPRIVDGTITAKEILDMDASYSAKVDLLTRMEHYQKQKGPLGESNPDQVRELLRRIHAPPGAADRIETQKPLNDAVLDPDPSKRISIAMRNELARQLDDRDDPVKQPYGVPLQRFGQSIAASFTVNLGSGMSENFNDRWALVMQMSRQRVQEYIDKGKDVNELFDPQHPNSLYRLAQTHRPTLQEAVKRRSDAMRAAEQPQPGQPGSAPAKAGQIPTKIERLGQKTGDVVTGIGADGVTRAYRFKGGDPKAPSNYEPVTPPNARPNQGPALPGPIDLGVPTSPNRPPTLLPGMFGR